MIPPSSSTLATSKEAGCSTKDAALQQVGGGIGKYWQTQSNNPKAEMNDAALREEGKLASTGKHNQTTPKLKWTSSRCRRTKPLKNGTFHEIVSTGDSNATNS